MGRSYDRMLKRHGENPKNPQILNRTLKEPLGKLKEFLRELYKSFEGNDMKDFWGHLKEI